MRRSKCHCVDRTCPGLQSGINATPDHREARLCHGLDCTGRCYAPDALTADTTVQIPSYWRGVRVQGKAVNRRSLDTLRAVPFSSIRASPRHNPAVYFFLWQYTGRPLHRATRLVGQSVDEHDTAPSRAQPSQIHLGTH